MASNRVTAPVPDPFGDCDPFDASPARSAPVAPKPVPAPSPVPVPPVDPPPGPPPAPPAVSVDNIVVFNTPSADRNLRHHFEDINSLISIDATMQPVRVTYGTGNLNKGGHFSPAQRGPRPKKPSRRKFRGDPDGWTAAAALYRNRVDEYNASTPQPEIRVVRLAGGTDAKMRNAVFHEWAHAADYIPADSGTGALGMQIADQQRIRRAKTAASTQEMTRHRWDTTPCDTGEPVDDFIAAASQCESLTRYSDGAESPDGRRPDFANWQYVKSPVELWARAVAQWATRELDGDVMLGSSAGSGSHWFTPTEIDRLAPHIEKVLSSRGQLRRSTG